MIFNEPELKTEATYSVAEHEVLMSFVNDSDAVLFHEWWHDIGCREFLKWVKKNGGEK